MYRRIAEYARHLRVYLDYQLPRASCSGDSVIRVGSAAEISGAVHRRGHHYGGVDPDLRQYSRHRAEASRHMEDNLPVILPAPFGQGPFDYRRKKRMRLDDVHIVVLEN